VVVCLDAATGEPVWEHGYAAAYQGLGGYGAGPRSTPLLAAGRLFTVGVSGTLLALDKQDGRVLWRRELWGPELAGNVLGHGYASSPVAWGDLVILPVGGAGAGLVAFDQASGEIVWRGLDVRNSYSSPRVAELLGEPQLVAFMAEEVVGVAPATGRLLWSYPHANQWGHNIAPPKVVGDDTVFVSSPQAGARGLRLSRDGDGIRVEQLWKSRSVQFYHGTTVAGGEWIYGSSGTLAPAFLIAINARTGEIGWRSRDFAKANCVGVGDLLLVLDEDGTLYLADASPQAIEVLAEARLLDRVAWTVPTVVGRTLYARNQERIVAVDLGGGDPGAVDLG
jgi:outer membrane protein assembly factor BamB